MDECCPLSAEEVCLALRAYLMRSRQHSRGMASAEPSNSGLDDVHLKRLENEMDNYHQWMDERTEDCYQIAEKARKCGLDHTDFVEIPRAADLAGRTEKLLVDYLNGMEIADDIRVMLAEFDRETTSIKMAQQVALRFKANGEETVRSIDVGVRVGLAILTEAVLVAPLEGISEVRLLNNVDGTEFVSLHFAGPIRAAGGTAQALAVLIADMIRRELDIGPYVPTQPEVERVKEEFGLYRGNLQYRPPPEEVDLIVKACPIMINGESTESIECSGYGHVRNIDEPRIRGGVLLVIGEGMCLKAPKIQKHTERMGVAGWEFISKFAEKKNKDADNSDSYKSKQVKPISKFMKDIIAGRPVFGEPLARGGFRLRYGRSRASGLAAGSINAAGMAAMDDFLTIGTQMKIERPGKACAVTPCDELEGPWTILRDGRFLRIDDATSWKNIEAETITIWDNGEIALGYGEFMENNKELVPAGYCTDWWASELIEKMTTEKQVEKLVSSLGIKRAGLPPLPINRHWHLKLRKMKINWQQAKNVSQDFGTSLPPPHNPWWADYPLPWVGPLMQLLESATIEKSETVLASVRPLKDGVQAMPSKDKNQLRIKNAVRGWSHKPIIDDKIENVRPGEELVIPELIFDYHKNSLSLLQKHGLAKVSALLLGLPHHHDGDDLLITSGWQALLEGLGLEVKGSKIIRLREATSHLEDRTQKLQTASVIILEEKARLDSLNSKRRQVRISSETKARQKGATISETDNIGREAMKEVEDLGPKDAEGLFAAKKLEDEHAITGTLWLVRKCSSLRWENSVSIRIGARMGRPEKAAPREKPVVHSLFPIGADGGPQRLMSVAVDKDSYRAEVGKRRCQKCGQPTITLRCNIINEETQQVCGGRSEMPPLENEKKGGRRRGVLQTIKIASMMEKARVNLGLDRLPKQIKGMKKLMSKDQTPEALEKGILRATHGVPVFRDGTVRFDMSDVPITHFTADEISVPWPRLLDLGYSHDIDGNALESGTQMVEIFPQDFIVSKAGADFFLRTAKYLDDLLERFYGLPRFYNAEVAEDLIGQLLIGLAPHTSGGVLSRIIGWSNSSGGYAHTLFHASKRRNCDGDEDAIMLLMDGLLNFSKKILPANRGGQMDAPLVLTTRLNPTEVDKEALNVDAAWYYPSSFYEASKQQVHPKVLQKELDIVENRLGDVSAVRGYGYTHDTRCIDEGPALSAYKTLETMVDKMNGQLRLGGRLRAVDVKNVASSVVRSHFLPDLRGNLVAFTRQKIRCVSCGHSYRRMPLSGQCIQLTKRAAHGLGSHGVSGGGRDTCKGNLALTVSQGAVRKYIKVTKHVMETYGVDHYTKQNVEWLAASVESLFNNDKAKQLSLADFL